MKGKWFALGCLTSVVVVLAITLSLFFSLGKMTRAFQKPAPAPLKSGSYLYLKLQGEISDYAQISGPFSFRESLAVNTLIVKIAKAAEDKDIAGIIMEPKYLSCGFAVLHELITALEEFRKSGKPVYTLLDTASNKEYLLASVTDAIYLNPSASAGIFLSGLGSEIIFYKDMFDKLGIEFTLFNAGEYKEAGETFTRRNLSDPVRNNIKQVYYDIYDNMVTTIAASRTLDKATIKHLFENRDELFINGQKAIDYGLVDHLSSREDMLENLAIEDDKLVLLSDYKIPKIKQGKQIIAVVYLQGMIVPFPGWSMDDIISSGKVAEIIDDIEDNDDIKAVVLRINSPGGSALESEILLEMFINLQEKKPMVVSMGNLAASGGYYISASADYIMADPYTITGSIGVAAMFPNITRLADKIGLDNEQLGIGKYSNFASIYEEMSPEVKAKIIASVQSTYLEFKTRVSEGRGISLDDVEVVARGQVWVSKRAQEMGLIDAVGNLAAAVRKAAELAGIEQYSTQYLPEKKSFLQKFLEERMNLDLKQALLQDELIQSTELDRLLTVYSITRRDPVVTLLPYDLGL
ncbi:MAG: signal peptide peptidase SppA [Candidatus Cloacimonetes bacterium]|nr:signal peptide peptidase SppA [Candidatus Cloacimonadota bacterium]